MDIKSKEEGGKYRELTLISQVEPQNHIPNIPTIKAIYSVYFIPKPREKTKEG